MSYLNKYNRSRQQARLQAMRARRNRLAPVEYEALLKNECRANEAYHKQFEEE